VKGLKAIKGMITNATVYAAAIPASAKAPDAARALIRFLQTPDSKAVMKAKGLDPI